MIVNAPPNRARRLLTFPKGGPIFGYWLVFAQINGPNTVVLGTTVEEAGGNETGGVQDGLQLNQNNQQNPFTVFLWRGELWAMAQGAIPVQFIVVVPGQEPLNLPCEGEV